MPFDDGGGDAGDGANVTGLAPATEKMAGACG